MAPARYAPLPNPRTSPDAEREMDDAFDDDDRDEHNETTPLTVQHPRSPEPIDSSRQRSDSFAGPGAYDFERDYDYPPPGSPPPPSTVALPNNIGNSNGLLPTSPVTRAPRRSFFRRTVGALLPQYYQRIGDGRPRGGGTDNDGVFANVTAKPVPAVTVHSDSGDVHMVPEETQNEAPPSYSAASADAVPSYWENTVHAPSAMDLNGDMIIDELPTGSIVSFVMTTLISWFFQLPGFVLTYLLHGSHAGRFGSQAGLALTLIQYGFGTTVADVFPSPDDMMQDGTGIDSKPDGSSPISDGMMHGGFGDGTMMGNSTMGGEGPSLADLQAAYVGHEWISFILMTIGWFLLLTSLIGYFRVKRFELSVRASRGSPAALTAEDVQRDIALRRNLEDVFGISVVFESEAAALSMMTPPDTATMNQRMATPRTSEEVRLERDLRNAGLL
ncbi:hypothetical protein BC834DRAFT_57370 [Gloeopeniophorella convolvens]|nr:hypothetical protein BC834DRAFT_57370 [Gloeopeniophorella convolvens]